MAEKKVVGIDFTSREIRIAQISYSRGLPKIERFAIGPIPDGVFSGGRLVEPGRLSEAIKDLIRGYRINGKKAILGISGRYGVTRMITLPKMTAAQTRDAINLQLNQYVPFPPGDSLYDFKSLREIKEAETPSQEVLLVASRRSSIQPLLKVVKNAGLNLIGIKITTLASFGLFEDLYLDNEQAIAFVDVRDTVTDISFVAENYFRLSRSIEFGLITLTERIRTKLGLNYTEAVEHFYQNKVDLMESYRPAADMTSEEGVIDAGPTEGSGDPAELDRQLGLAKSQESSEKQIRDAVLRSMGQFVNELMRSIRYFESQAKRRSRVGRVVIFGYIGGLEGLHEYLAEQTALEVTVVTDLPGVENALDAADEQELRDKEAVLVVPMGLGVEGVKKKKIELNLIPREAVFRRKSFNALKFAIVVVIIVAAVLANVYIKKNNEYNELKAQEDELTRKINSIQQYYDRSQEFKNHTATVQEKLKGVITLAAMQPPWPVIMDELGRIMRDSAWITEMHWDANGATWSVKGAVVGTDELQKLIVNIWHSDILELSEAPPTDPENLDMDEGHLGPGFGGGGRGGAGFGFSTERPSEYSDDISAPTIGTTVPPEFQDEDPIPRPEPVYKLPESGGSWRQIESYFGPAQYWPPMLYVFELSGTINPMVMKSGAEAFGTLSDLAGVPNAGQMAQDAGGGSSMPVGGAPPADTGGDSEGGTSEEGNE